MKIKIIRFLISVIFLFAGSTKVLGTAMQIAAFAHWGYPLWFMYLTGSLEILGAIGLWIPKLSKYANVCLIMLMFGAFYTHVTTGDPVSAMGLAIVASLLLLAHLKMTFRKTFTN